MEESNRGEGFALTENLRLREELWRQWKFNHAEHCGHEGSHDVTQCHWPPPMILNPGSLIMISVPPFAEEGTGQRVHHG